MWNNVVGMRENNMVVGNVIDGHVESGERVQNRFH